MNLQNIAFITALALEVVITPFPIAHGQDIDCLQSHVSCSNKLVGDLELKLKIWNNANCSVRDICTPINETGEMPP